MSAFSILHSLPGDEDVAKVKLYCGPTRVDRKYRLPSLNHSPKDIAKDRRLNDCHKFGHDLVLARITALCSDLFKWPVSAWSLPMKVGDWEER